MSPVDDPLYTVDAATLRYEAAWFRRGAGDALNGAVVMYLRAAAALDGLALMMERAADMEYRPDTWHVAGDGTLMCYRWDADPRERTGKDTPLAALVAAQQEETT